MDRRQNYRVAVGLLALLVSLAVLSCSGYEATTAVLSSDASLRTLTVSAGALNPTFSSGTTAYTVGVSNSTASLTVTASTTDNGASITLNGAARGNSGSSVINLTVGTTTVTLLVTAENEVTTRTYVVVIARAAPIGA